MAHSCSHKINYKNKNPNSKYLPHVLAGTYNFDPTDFVDSEKFTITQSGENWIVAEKSQRR